MDALISCSRICIWGLLDINGICVEILTKNNYWFSHYSGAFYVPAFIGIIFEHFFYESLDPCTRDIKLIERFKPLWTGPCIGYYDNGILRYEGQLVKGSYEGVWNYYNPEGNLEIETNFKNNERDAIWTYFDNEGNIINTERYIDGELIETN